MKRLFSISKGHRESDVVTLAHFKLAAVQVSGLLTAGVFVFGSFDGDEFFSLFIDGSKVFFDADGIHLLDSDRFVAVQYVKFVLNAEESMIDVSFKVWLKDS